MNLRIEVPANLESLLRLRAKEAGVNVESYVLNTISERLACVPTECVPPEESDLSAEQFSQWITKWANQFPTSDGQIDDSRESIYAGRGE